MGKSGACNINCVSKLPTCAWIAIIAIDDKNEAQALALSPPLIIGETGTRLPTDQRNRKYIESKIHTLA